MFIFVLLLIINIYLFKRLKFLVVFKIDKIINKLCVFWFYIVLICMVKVNLFLINVYNDLIY